ncbi:MAG: ABC transporter ATP-binding protein/permease [Caldilineaceae bacterium]|nr:ABC transporter ATP-binding protein/permease [Caldilineaceae bacterium]
MTPLIRFVRLIDGPSRRKMALSILFGMLFAATTLAPPLLIRRLILWLTEGAVTGSLVGMALLLLGIFTLRGLFRYYYGHFSHQAAYAVLHELLVRVYAHLQRLSHRFYNNQRTGSLISRSISDIEAIEDFVAHGIPDLVLAVVVPAAMLVVLFFIDPWLTLIVIAPLPIAGLIIYRFTGNIRRMWRRVRSGLAELIAQVQDNFSGMTEIKSFGREADQARRVERRSAEFRDASIAANNISLLPAGIVEWAGGLGILLAVWVGGGFALEGRMSVANLFVFVAYLGHIYQPFLKLADIGDVLHKAASSCERVFELLDVEPEIVSPPQAIIPTNPQPAIAFRNVTFGYQDETPVLYNVSFEVAPGEMVALVGATGAGKSTIHRLLARFYDPQQGAVYVAGHDLRTLDLEWLRGQIAAVLQDVFLFHGAVRENICFGAAPGVLDPSDEALYAAARAANADEFVDRLPQGYDTMIGERGVRLSGGQKQRLAIARALLKDAPILVLDEATSSVDVETEALIQEAFSRLTRHRTTLVIAHRLSTIRHADKILVLDQGRIVESGTHESLLARNGAYARLVRAQQVADTWQLGVNGAGANGDATGARQRRSAHLATDDD